MKMEYCHNCGMTMGHKRHIGVGTLLLVFITGGLWLIIIPFYQVRCIKCGNGIGTVLFLWLLFFVLPVDAQAAGHQHPEKYYQQQWCAAQGGQMEAVLPDRTRCDCLTSRNAVEVDFAVKWYQAIGQSLYYSLQTGKRAGIVLIIETPKDRKYWIRMNSTIEHFKLPIDTWEVEP